MLKLKNQSGALFGVDARISMVIFAVLSVAVGAFTFGRIQTARDTALISELTEIDQAIRELQSDIGTFTSFAMERVEKPDNFAALWDVNRLNLQYQNLWNGPYYSKHEHTSAFYGEYSLEFLPDDHLSGTCTYKNECYVWIKLTNVPLEVWQRINTHFDQAGERNKEDAETAHRVGKIRAGDSYGEEITLYYRSISRKGN